MTLLQRHAYGIGAGFAALLWPFFWKRRRLSRENVLRCGITSDPAEAARIAKTAWRHLAGHICEALFVPKSVAAGDWRERLDVSEADPESASLVLDPPKEPILIVSGHHGAWEVATNVLTATRPMIAVARRVNNKFVARWMAKHHFRGPVTLVDKKKGFTREILRQWEDDKAAMTILMDQHYSKGAKLTFLGRPARTITSAARLAVRTGHPAVVGSFVRVAPYRYKLVGGPPLRFERGADIEAAAQAMNDRLSEVVRKYPEQYLWVHRRWRDD
jgi:KDO2-lipid IV(A) lauroyltransferase